MLDPTTWVRVFCVVMILQSLLMMRWSWVTLRDNRRALTAVARVVKSWSNHEQRHKELERQLGMPGAQRDWPLALTSDEEWRRLWPEVSQLVTADGIHAPIEPMPETARNPRELGASKSP